MARFEKSDAACDLGGAQVVLKVLYRHVQDGVVVALVVPVGEVLHDAYEKIVHGDVHMALAVGCPVEGKLLRNHAGGEDKTQRD